MDSASDRACSALAAGTSRCRYLSLPVLVFLPVRPVFVFPRLRPVRPSYLACPGLWRRHFDMLLPIDRCGLTLSE
ncbi:hypothetical protein [Streptomyces sp. DI166]|uniref:hypothetical protein n=1 Tax=Streptomyces sp. DI166 TaxID=1839783 RepID=UPI000B81BE3F|nr:hypothetical protein [Streptomyces sp. DI166]